MTAKEKADELVKKFSSVDFEDGEAKEFANIVCDGVISALEDIEISGTERQLFFWEEVKKEVSASS